MGQTIKATFETRQAVELAVEHLVQEHGIERTDIFIEPVSTENSAGTDASGGDSDSADQAKPEAEPALNGALLLSVDLNEDNADAIRASIRESGGTEMSAG